MTKFEEIHEISPFWSWAILVVFCAAIVGWGLLNYFLIPDTPRQWNVGQLPDVPGESVYSTSEAKPGLAPRQIEPLPQVPPQEPPTDSQTQAASAPTTGGRL